MDHRTTATKHGLLLPDRDEGGTSLQRVEIEQYPFSLRYENLQQTDLKGICAILGKNIYIYVYQVLHGALMLTNQGVVVCYDMEEIYVNLRKFMSSWEPDLIHSHQW